MYKIAAYQTRLAHQLHLDNARQMQTQWHHELKKFHPTHFASATYKSQLKPLKIVS